MKSINIKLLNTVLSGCEYEIRNNENLFVVIDKIWLEKNQSLDVPDKAILIPTENNNRFNFSITFPNEENHSYKAIVHSQDGEIENEEIILTFQQIFTIGGVQIVIKPVTEEWCGEFLNITNEEPIINKSSHVVKKNKKNVYYLIFFFIICFASFFAWYIFNEPQRRTQDISVLLAPSNVYQVMLGTDKNVYIFASNSKNIKLAKGLLQNSSFSTSKLIKFKNKIVEKKSISGWLTLNRSNIKLNLINLDDPEYPEFFLSSERNPLMTQEQKNRLQQDLIQRMPYAKHIKISYLSDKILIDNAMYGLKQLDLQYTRETNNLYSAFIIHGELDDSDIVRLKQFISDYHQIWGEDYVQFVVSLKDDYFKNFPFKIGIQNYVKISKNHWHLL